MSGGIRRHQRGGEARLFMKGKVFLPVILTMAALLFSFPVHAQEQRAGCLVTAVAGETGEQRGDGVPFPSPPVMPSPQTGEDNDILAGPPEQDGGLWVFSGVGSVCGWLMLLLFFLLLLLLLCLTAWLTGGKTGRERRENVREK